MRLFLSLSVLIVATACSLGSMSHQSRLIGDRDVHPKIRNAIAMRPDQQLETCGKFVLFDSSRQFSVKDKLEPFSIYEVLVSADGPVNYYDNSSGVLIAECGIWHCGYDNKRCADACPPSQWNCSKQVP
jgi:hypothetical protein